jgi:hypothetical protein
MTIQYSDVSKCSVSWILSSEQSLNMQRKIRYRKLNSYVDAINIAIWLQIRRPGFDSRKLPEKKVVGLERGPLSLASTTEELLDRKVAAPV